MSQRVLLTELGPHSRMSYTVCTVASSSPKPSDYPVTPYCSPFLLCLISSSHFTMFFSIVLGLCAQLTAARAPGWTHYNFPQAPSNVSIDTPDTVQSTPFDGVYIPKPNATSYEWWYFDAVATDLSQSVVFQPLIDSTRPSQVTLLFSYSLPNGSYVQLEVPTSALSVSTAHDGSSAVAADGVFAWRGAPDLSEYNITLDWPEYGISGQIQLVSVSSPPCHI